MISIVDYGMGNLYSVEKALEHQGAPSRLISSADEVASAEKLIVPGVGAFGDAICQLERNGMIEALRDYAISGRPILGVCLGMQILFESSEEDPGVAGLGVFPGSVKRFPASSGKVPHMGWNRLDVKPGSRVLVDLGEAPYVYFVHSYYVDPADESVTAARTPYGLNFTSAVERGAVCGVQFHPEKSQRVGLQILKNFAGR